VISLDPQRLEDVLADILHVGARIGREREADELVDALRARLERVERARRGIPRPTAVALEWLDPPFLGGHWVPQMLAIAGFRDPFAVAPGERSRRATWEEIAAADPDWLLAMPCGFDAAGAAGELGKLVGHPVYGSLRAVRAGRVAPLDANGCFSRPGPRLVDGVETLAALLDA
jgi:iron complex transport system substrate-binding protein